MGGGGGHQPISQSMEAELFQGHPKEPEGWETTVYITYAATVVILTCALGFAPDTSIKTVSNRMTIILVSKITRLDLLMSPPFFYISHLITHFNTIFCTVKLNKQWASAEARARLEMQAEGKLDKPVFGVHYNTPEALGLEGDWEKFWVKSTKPGEDDDDDDEEDEEEEEVEEEDDDE
jgi:hypothetical protein